MHLLTCPSVTHQLLTASGMLTYSQFMQLTTLLEAESDSRVSTSRSYCAGHSCFLFFCVPLSTFAAHSLHISHESGSRALLSFSGTTPYALSVDTGPRLWVKTLKEGKRWSRLKVNLRQQRAHCVFNERFGVWLYCRHGDIHAAFLHRQCFCTSHRQVIGNSNIQPRRPGLHGRICSRLDGSVLWFPLFLLRKKASLADHL